MAVITPIGISVGDSSVRAARSARIMKMAPVSTESGSRKRWSAPQIRRTAWGMMMPTKPIVPDESDAGRRDQRGRRQQDQLEPLHVHAELLRLLLVELHDIEQPGEDDDHRRPHGDVRQDHAYLRPLAQGEAAHQPEDDAVHLSPLEMMR